MAVGRRRPRDTQVGLQASLSMQGATRRTRPLRLKVGRRCVTLGIFRHPGPSMPNWALDSSRGALAADFGREMSLGRS